MKRLLAVAVTFAVGSAAYAEEKKIAESEVPRPVLEQVKKKYPAAKFAGFEQEVEDGKTAYEIKLSDGDRRLEVVCAPDGKILVEEEQIAIDAVPEKVRAALKASARYGAWTVKGAERVIAGGKTDAPSYEIKVAKGGARAELVFSADGKLTKTEEKKGKD